MGHGAGTAWPSWSHEHAYVGWGSAKPSPDPEIFVALDGFRVRKPGFESREEGVALVFGGDVAASSGWALGYYNEASADNAVAIGSGARASVVNGTAVGKFNASMSSNDAVVIGAGTNADNRFTAIRVTNGGGVYLGRPQGDISMGAYSN